MVKCTAIFFGIVNCLNSEFQEKEISGNVFPTTLNPDWLITGK